MEQNVQACWDHHEKLRQISSRITGYSMNTQPASPQAERRRNHQIASQHETPSFQSGDMIYTSVGTNFLSKLLQNWAVKKKIYEQLWIHWDSLYLLD